MEADQTTRVDTKNHAVILEARNITKRYGACVAIDSVSFEIRSGEVLALVGDNGAGKSTIVKVLSGAVQPDSGEIYLRGARVKLTDPKEARSKGIETVYQDLALAQILDVSTNLHLGREVLYGGLLKPLCILNRKAMVRHAMRLLGDLNITVQSVAGVPVEKLSGGQRQAVAVARAAAYATDVLFMDEPTAALGARQSQAVLAMARRVAERGAGVVLITHILPHVMETADRIVVLRHARKVADLPREAATQEGLVSVMVGANETRTGDS